MPVAGLDAAQAPLPAVAAGQKTTVNRIGWRQRSICAAGGANTAGSIDTTNIKRARRHGGGTYNMAGSTRRRAPLPAVAAEPKEKENRRGWRQLGICAAGGANTAGRPWATVATRACRHGGGTLFYKTTRKSGAPARSPNRVLESD